MNGLYLDCDNNFSRHISENLYLNSTMADIKFQFRTPNGNIDVPGHKVILSCGSPIFHSMFTNHLTSRSNKIPIENVSISAFKEFLQFFYLAEVRLTPNNIYEVANLCQKFGINDLMKSCSNSLQRTLVIDDMCWGYSLAIALEDPILIQYCEDKIAHNPFEILESESFLECSLGVLGKILGLVTFKCNAMEIVNACMRWAKADCAHNEMLRTPTNLRMSLGNLFNRIPFQRLTLTQFSQFILAYKRMLTGDEMNGILNVIMEIPDKVESSSTIECDRQISWAQVSRYNFGSDIFTAFSTNRQVLLSEFSAKLCGTAKHDSEICYDVSMRCTEFDTKLISGLATISKGSDELCVVLPQPVIIAAEEMHFINVYMWNTDCIDFRDECVRQPVLGNRIQRGDLEINFKTSTHFDCDSITRLIFEKCEGYETYEGF